MADITPWDRHLNPECANGKHGNCHRDAWCYIEDCKTLCLCDCHKKARS